MVLAIDIGNTLIKAGIFHQKEIRQYFHTIQKEELEALHKKFQFRFVIISSVREDSKEIIDLFSSAEKVLIMGPELSIPIVNRYKTPMTLGMDRLAGAVGASELFPSLPKLVIDAGTCITYDFTNKQNQYQGGSIAPGIEMRFKSLHAFTRKLPLIEKKYEFPFIGQNTEESILSGIMNGILAETEGIINRYRNDNEDLKVIFCGGDAGFFESKIKQPIFVVPDLILRGLNAILLHNVS